MIDPKFQMIAMPRLSSAQRARLNAGIAAYGHEWKHSSFDWLKKHLKTKLRQLQSDRCCYCRRVLIFDKGLVEIEHVVNKAKGGRYAHYTFVLKNLALSCKDCNNGKGTKAVLTAALPINSPYPTSAASFLWVHPHFHNYSEHLLIHDAWVYEANGGSPDGLAVITKCKLADLSIKEQANRTVRIQSSENFAAALKKAVGMVEEVGLDRLCQELSPILATMMGIGGNSSRADAAIRAAHSAVQTAAAEALAAAA